MQKCYCYLLCWNMKHSHKSGKNLDVWSHIETFCHFLANALNYDSVADVLGSLCSLPLTSDWKMWEGFLHGIWPSYIFWNAWNGRTLPTATRFAHHSVTAVPRPLWWQPSLKRKCGLNFLGSLRHKIVWGTNEISKNKKLHERCNFWLAQRNNLH